MHHCDLYCDGPGTSCELPWRQSSAALTPPPVITIALDASVLFDTGKAVLKD